MKITVEFKEKHNSEYKIFFILLEILLVFILWERPMPDHKYKASGFRRCNLITATRI